jgi:hypothetical protein
MEWALLVSYLYPLFTRRVCVCACGRARAVGTWSSTRPVVGRWLLREELRLPRTRGNRSVPLLLTFFPCDSVFFSSLLPCFRLLSFPHLFSSALLLNQVLQNLIHIWWNCKRKSKSFVGSQLQWTWMPGCSFLVWLLLLLFSVRTVRFVISEREDFSIDLYIYI